MTSLTPQPRANTAVSRMMVVDDNPAVVEVISEILALNQMDVVALESGEAAVAALSADNAFDGAIIDLVMPSLSGIALLDRLRSIRSDLPIIVMSGYNTPETHDALATRPRTAFLQKPFGVRALLDVIQELTTPTV